MLEIIADSAPGSRGHRARVKLWAIKDVSCKPVNPKVCIGNPPDRNPLVRIELNSSSDGFAVCCEQVADASLIGEQRICVINRESCMRSFEDRSAKVIGIVPG